MKEIWKDIKGYEGLYQVSNYGRIKHLKMTKTVNNGANITIPEIILKQQIIKGGYRRVMLYKNNKYKMFLVHRLVAQAFIPNPENKPFVLHKKRVLSGGTNYVNNLYWGTRSENVKDSIKDGTWNRPHKKRKNIEILQYTKDEIFIKKWELFEQIPYALGHIYEVCEGKRKTAYGYKWKYNKTPQAIKVD